MPLFVLGLVVLIATLGSELAVRREWLPYWVGRKLLHLVAVGCCALACFTADSEGYRIWFTALVAGVAPTLWVLVLRGDLLQTRDGQRPWGIVWFPFALLLLLLTPLPAAQISFCLAVLAFCDPAAAIAGQLLAGHTAAAPHWWQRTVSLTGDPKTPIGSLAFLLSFLLLCAVFPSFSLPKATGTLLAARLPAALGWSNLLVAGVLLTLAEALGSRGSDNLWIPWLTALLLLLSPAVVTNSYWSLLLLVSLALFCWVTVRRRSLSPGGAATASLLGALIVLSVGPGWLWPLLLFFTSSSLIGKLFPATTAASDAKQQQPRDAIQVLANGGIYTLLALGWPLIAAAAAPLPGLLLLVAAATATADTWSSELGQYFRYPTRYLLNGRRVPPGLSGGISGPGSLAGLGGAAAIAIGGGGLLQQFGLGTFLFVTLGGFGGMLLDSVLGQWLQATYRHPLTRQLTDIRPPDALPHSGYLIVNNDLVNVLAILLTVLGAGAYCTAFGYPG